MMRAISRSESTVQSDAVTAITLLWQPIPSEDVSLCVCGCVCLCVCMFAFVHTCMCFCVCFGV